MRTKRAVLPLRYRHTGNPAHLVPPPYSTMPPASKLQLIKWYDELTTAEWRAGRVASGGSEDVQGQMKTTPPLDQTSSANRRLTTSTKKREHQEDPPTKASKEQRNDPQNQSDTTTEITKTAAQQPSESEDQPPAAKALSNFHNPKWSSTEKLMLFRAAKGKAIAADRVAIMAAYHAAGGQREFEACKKAYARFQSKGDTVLSLEGALGNEKEEEEEEEAEE
ncbi:hypothetical protein EJ03DRAFT_140716 [Teratosphaeria nubilosa]|uniref:Uncharacterized protein n=1 Tax=Teratosphaeria nubilosa TaxID=161662 RepID=A0A6G1L560_9PEZI|nr:hypothetical protein EJ03DRAFT_140716 [Teratosphaeria nubilosa]